MSDESTGCADDDSDLGHAIAKIAQNSGAIDRMLLSQRIERRINEQFAQHEDVYMRGCGQLHSTRLWRLRNTVLRVVEEEIAKEQHL